MFLISAGHHEAAQGATYQDGPTLVTEWHLAKEWQKRVVDLLGQHQAMAVPYGKLSTKVAFINERKPWIAMEIHFNSAKDAQGHHVGSGCETLYYPGSVKGELIAHYVQKGMAQHFKPNRGIKEGWYRMDKPGQVDYHGDVEGDEKIDYFLRETTCPAIIVEPEFIHKPTLIRQKQTLCCEAIADGLLKAARELDLI